MDMSQNEVSFVPPLVALLTPKKVTSLRHIHMEIIDHTYAGNSNQSKLMPGLKLFHHPTELGISQLQHLCRMCS